MDFVKKGQIVSFLCSSFSEDGRPLDDVEPEPLMMRAGSKGFNRFATAISELLLGMRLNQTKEFKIAGSIPFGKYDASRILKIDTAPSDSIVVGDQLEVNSPVDDGVVDGVVLSKGEDFVMLDTNHPLSNSQIVLRINIRSIRQ